MRLGLSAVAPGRPTRRARRRSGLLVGLLGLLGMVFVTALAGCVWAPYAPRDGAKLGPPGESQPVPGADANPLDVPRQLPVVCTPQGDPVVETPETQACGAEPDCRLVCSSAEDSLEAP